VFSGFHAGVGHEQNGFELFIKGLVNLSARKNRCQTAASFFEPSLQFAKPSLPTGVGCWRGVGFGAKETEHKETLYGGSFYEKLPFLHFKRTTGLPAVKL
jgi:hypothetical protein